MSIYFKYVYIPILISLIVQTYTLKLIVVCRIQIFYFIKSKKGLIVTLFDNLTIVYNNKVSQQLIIVFLRTTPFITFSIILTKVGY